MAYPKRSLAVRLRWLPAIALAPANLAFDGKGSVLVTNHAFVTGITNPEQFTVLDVWVADTGNPLEKPLVP